MLEGFTVFNFNEGVPYASVTKNGITFNKGTVMKLRYPEHVVFLINAEKKQFALQVCDMQTPNAMSFCTPEKRNGNVLSIRWNSRDMLNTISGIMGWDLSKAAYKVEGKALLEESAMLFDMNAAIELN